MRSFYFGSSSSSLYDCDSPRHVQPRHASTSTPATTSGEAHISSLWFLRAFRYPSATSRIDDLFLRNLTEYWVLPSEAAAAVLRCLPLSCLRCRCLFDHGRLRVAIPWAMRPPNALRPSTAVCTDAPNNIYDPLVSIVVRGQSLPRRCRQPPVEGPSSRCNDQEHK